MKAVAFLIAMNFVGILGVQAQDSLFAIHDSQKFQQKLNQEFENPETSPLSKEELGEFDGLCFFPIDAEFVVSARFTRTPFAQPFLMETTNKSRDLYVKYAEVEFVLNDKKHQLNVYQNQRLVNESEYEDYLFIPFTDLSNGDGTYEGGRYLDLTIPKNNKIILNFNKSYNPSCAYNSHYDCPIPPKENDLEINIKAGVKKETKCLSEANEPHSKKNG